jgi:ketosteroid isomerase-like protein
MKNASGLLTHLYAHFNAGDIDAVLAVLDEDVMWANGMDGGHVHGRDGVRQYWTRQWSMIDPHVAPLSFKARGDGSIVVEVHQTVRSLTGEILREQDVGHIFHIREGMIVRFDIGVADQSAV